MVNFLLLYYFLQAGQRHGLSKDDIEESALLSSLEQYQAVAKSDALSFLTGNFETSESSKGGKSVLLDSKPPSGTAAWMVDELGFTKNFEIDEEYIKGLEEVEEDYEEEEKEENDQISEPTRLNAVSFSFFSSVYPFCESIFYLYMLLMGRRLQLRD